jgi:MFS family permease
MFLPMTVLMIAASLLAGRWTVRAGPRWSITAGCVLFAAGLFLADGSLSPHPDYGLLMVALGLAGIGIGTTGVPVTSAVLSAVPPERSGMAASGTNTSREIGAVTGVAILGSLVISQLRSSLTVQLNHLGIPAQFQALVINAIETGQIPQNTSAYAGYGKIVQEVIGAAYTAFHDGLHVGAVPGGRPGPGRRPARVHHPALTPASGILTVCRDRAIEMMDSRRVPDRSR